jgi:hypothetical protein
MDKGIISVCQATKRREDVEELFFSEMCSVVTDSNISFSQDREKMYTKLHDLRLNEEFQEKLCSILTFSKQAVMDFSLFLL